MTTPASNRALQPDATMSLLPAYWRHRYASEEHRGGQPCPLTPLASPLTLLHVEGRCAGLVTHRRNGSFDGFDPGRTTLRPDDGFSAAPHGLWRRTCRWGLPVSLSLRRERLRCGRVRSRAVHFALLRRGDRNPGARRRTVLEEAEFVEDPQHVACGVIPQARRGPSSRARPGCSGGPCHCMSRGRRPAVSIRLNCPAP